VAPVGEGRRGTLKVEVVEEAETTVVGSYLRNYPAFFDTFCPFKKGGKDFALYSPDYTTTRVMSLPSCADLGGEEPATGGFCPVDYFVPADPDTGEAGDLGFVAGCIWGDDTSGRFGRSISPGQNKASWCTRNASGPLSCQTDCVYPRPSRSTRVIPARSARGCG